MAEEEKRDKIKLKRRREIESVLSLKEIKRKAVLGIIVLTSRTFFMQFVSLGATFLLTIFLDPAQYGLFFLVSAVINFFAYFSDIGLAAALIQKKGKLSSKELQTTFTTQQFLVVLLLFFIFLITPFLKNYYHLSQKSVWLLWSLAFSLLLSSLKTIPSILLERKLEFNKLIIPQLVETLFFNITAVCLAWQGFGVTSFTLAVLARGFSGLFLIYFLKPWKPRFAFSSQALKGLLSFGLPYQLNTFLAVIKDNGLIMVLGAILDPSAVGLLGWAQKWAQAPLRFFMDQVIKVTFPAFARMQENKKALTRAVTRSIFFVCLLVFPALVGLNLIAPLLTKIVPRYEKWQPALIALAFYSFNSAWAAVSTPLTNLFNALGEIKISLKLMVMWTVLTWIFIPLLAFFYGINGVAAGSALVGASSIIVIYISRRIVNFNLWQSIGKPLSASFFMGFFIFLFEPLLPVNWLGALILIGMGAALYAGFIYFLVGPSLKLDVKKVFHALRKK